MPIFDTCQEEGKIVGRLLAGYGELEFRLYSCLCSVMDNDNIAARIIYRARGEEQRIVVADGIMRTKYAAVGLGNPYSEAIADMHWCRKIRNQYAHCHWYLPKPNTNYGLSIINLEEAAHSNSDNIIVRRDYINLVVLGQQELYFIYVSNCLTYLEVEYQLREGKISSHSSPLPKKIARPRKYSDNPLY
jgi:hypothetical protein